MIPSAELTAQLDVQTAVGGELHGVKPILITDADGSVADNAVPGALHEASFTGYTPGGATVTWSVSYVPAQGVAEASGANVVYSCTGAGTVQNITGVAYLDSTGAKIVGIDFFDEPIAIQNVHDGFTYTPTAQLISG